MLGLLASTLVSMALLSTAYAAELAVSTQNASSISPTSAVLNSMVDVTGSAASVWFEYGTSSDLLVNYTPIQMVGLNFTPQSFSRTLTNLSANTTYYFRAAVQSASSSSEPILHGEIVSFITSASQGQDPGNDPGSTGSSCDAQTEINLTTDTASSISGNSALLSGTVNTSICNVYVWFEYGKNGSLSNSTPKSRVGLNYTAAHYNYPASDLDTNASYSFRIAAQRVSDNSIEYGSTLTFNTLSASESGLSSAPGVTTNSASSKTLNSAVLDATIEPNGSYTSAWFEYGTSEGLGNTIGTKGISSNDEKADFNYALTGLSANTIYYFRAVAQNDSGTTRGNIYIFITGPAEGAISLGRPTVFTAAPLLVKETSALLNGNAIANGGSTSVWFEWSEDANFTGAANKNSPQNIGQNNSETYFAYSLTNLVLGKTYYFRAVAQNPYGTSYGETKNFTTKISAQPAVNNSYPKTSGALPAGKPAASALTLEAEFDNNNPPAGTKNIYAISYTNNTNSVLKDAILKITLPNEANYLASSFANAGQDGNTITLKIGDIAAKGSGSASIKIKINSLAKAQTLKFSAELSYDIAGKNGKENISNELKVSNYSLTASVLETLGSIFSNLFVDFILGLLIGAGAYHYFVINKKGKADAEDPLK